MVACSNDSNSTPTPVISTGGGGSGGTGGGHSGGADNSAGDNSAGDNNANAGSTQGGSANAGAAGAAEAGEGGTGGEAGTTTGAGGKPATCPTSDLGFYNQPTTSQSQVFNNVQRLGTHTTLPSLPGT
jgi:hypothetical protein